MKNIIPNTVICWDSEWVPCARTGRRLYNLPLTEMDDSVFQRMWQEAGATLEKPRPFLKLAVSEIVSISAIVRRHSPHGAEFELVSWPSNVGAYRDEATLIERFLEYAAGQQAQLVGYNSGGADLPILVERGIANGCVCPQFGHRPEKPWEGTDYWNRFGEANLDLMQVMSMSAGRGAAMPSLHEMANACGVPGKLETAGDDVAQMWLDGKHHEIIAYNETDACTTYLLWLRYARFRGMIGNDEARRERDSFRRYLEEMSSSKPHIGKFLDAWNGMRLPPHRPPLLKAV